jgi:hypothetical protein
MFKYHAEARLHFVETKEVNKKGKKVKIPVIARTLYLDGKCELYGVEHYKVTATKRGGEMKFGVHAILPPVKEKWPTLKLSPTVHSGKYVREPKSYDLDGILLWLKVRVADGAEALTALLTAMPEREAA